MEATTDTSSSPPIRRSVFPRFSDRPLQPWSQLDATDQEIALRRPLKSDGTQYLETVKEITTRVRQEGDAALRAYGIAFDRWQGDWIETALEVPKNLWIQALDVLTPGQRQALARAIDQITRFHKVQAPQDYQITVSRGITCARRFRPIERVGIYVPAGQAPLPSSLLMAAVPAKLAGCKQRIICTSARPDGSVHPGILAAAALADATALYRVGGAHSIAAMAYGTQEIPKVDKIFGPGNAYVTAAKTWCSLDPLGAAIDMPAGPSEVMVIADAFANPDFVAADLLSQAEHGSDSHVVLVVMDPDMVKPILAAVKVQLLRLKSDNPGSYLRAEQSLGLGAILYADDQKSCIDIINRYAPEHLIIQIQNPMSIADHVDHAGSIFIGAWTPESLGDYASGTNHVLPTYGAARSLSGLGLEAFFKSTTIQEATREGLRDLGPTVMELAGLEGLAAHGAAVQIRLDDLKSSRFTDSAPFSNATSSQVRPWKLARPEIALMTGYQSARSLQATRTDQVYLDANESPRDPFDGRGFGLNRYPDPQPQELVVTLSQIYNVPPQNLMVTAGADQGIDVLVRAFCQADRDQILITPPTYGYYEVCASLQGCGVARVPLEGTGFKLNRSAILKTVFGTKNHNIKLVFICSPNNPTGMGFGLDELTELAQNLAPHALLVVDEAYLEFTERPSMTTKLGAVPNLVVLRTLSKAFGLAGLRVGCLLAHPELIKLLQKVRPPYPLSQSSVEKALIALKSQASLREAVADNTKRRHLLRSILESHSLVEQVYDSETNFLLVRCTDGATLLRRCQDHHLVIRDRSSEPGLEQCVRITVGSEAEILQLKRALSQ